MNEIDEKVGQEYAQRQPVTVRAKFMCVSRTQRKGWGGHEWFWDYKFQAVTDGSEENKSFFASTPSGNLDLTAVNGDLFVPGNSYYLDFTITE